VVIIGDAGHLYENIFTQRPCPITYHVGEMMDAFETILQNVPTTDHIIPGHDPSLMHLYPPAARGLEGAVVRLDLPPCHLDQKD
jgi:hypothetical protein